ncbi:T9SS type A sorting domain-containing protein, partial [Klebsiella pneumoniae]|nr:T9SS type A sorting domain-containing protein [Klebsiella pneumoniae]
IAGTAPLAAGTQVFANTTYYGALPQGSCVPLAVTITEILGNGRLERSRFTYYPNPVKDVLTLKYADEITRVEVYNLMGQKI